MATKELDAAASMIEDNGGSSGGGGSRCHRRHGRNHRHSSQLPKMLKEVEQQLIDIGSHIAGNDFKQQPCAYHYTKFTCGEV